MTDQISTEQPIDEQGLAAEATANTAEQHAIADAQEPAEAGREAAKYRRRLRETEGERDHLRTQLDAAREAYLDVHLAGEILISRDGLTRNVPIDAAIARAERLGNREEVAHLREKLGPGVEVDLNADMQRVTLRNPGDLFTIGGLERAACFQDDGTLDTEAIQSAVTKLHATRPELFTNKPRPVPGIDKKPERNHLQLGGWQDALRVK